MPVWLTEKRRGKAARAALCGLTLLGLAQRCGTPETAGASVLPFAALWGAGLVGLWVLYGAWLRLNRPLSGVRWWALAALFAGIMTLGRSFSALGTAEWLKQDPFGALCFFAGRVPLYFAVLRLAERALTAKAMPRNARWLIPLRMAVLLLCWLPWYVCTFPGVVSNDSITQLMQIYGLTPMTNANPVFQTWLIDVFRRVGLALGGADAAVALYCITQAMLMAWLLASLLGEIAGSRAPRALYWGSFGFYALCPVFPLFAFCVGKDTNFAMAVLWLSLSVWRFTRLKADERPGAAAIAGLLLSSAFCVLLRNPGVYLALITLGVLLCQTLRKNRRPTHAWRPVALTAALTLSLYASLQWLILPALNVAPMPETENYSVPLQQVARVAAGGELTAEEAEAVNGVLVLDELHAAYNGELSDPVKLLWREEATPEQKSAFWKTWLRLVPKHPETCLSASFHNAYGYLYPGYVIQIKPTLLIGDQSGKLANVQGTFDYSVNPRSEALKAFTDRLAQNPLYRALVAPGLYGWVALFALFGLAKKGRRDALPALLPSLFTLAGNLLSPVNGYFRYAMPLYICAPMLCWLCAMRFGDEEARP